MGTTTWTYMSNDGRRPAAREVRQLTAECKKFLRECDSAEFLREIRAMMSDQPPEYVDVGLMLDYIFDLRDIAVRIKSEAGVAL